MVIDQASPIFSPISGFVKDGLGLLQRKLNDYFAPTSRLSSWKRWRKFLEIRIHDNKITTNFVLHKLYLVKVMITIATLFNEYLSIRITNYLAKSIWNSIWHFETYTNYSGLPKFKTAPNIKGFPWHLNFWSSKTLN